MHKVKSAPIHGFKALLSEGPGVFEAVVSVFGNVDYAGDRVLPGAFAASLDRWKSSGDPIPVVWSHQWDDLDAHVGEVLEAKELLPGAPELAGTPIAENGGLWIKARIDVDDPDEGFARRLWKRLEGRRIREFSFAYDVLDERRSTDGANDLVELDVIEVGPTLKGMNPATVLLTAKSLAARVKELGPDADADELERIIAAGIAEGEKAAVDEDQVVDHGTKAVVRLAGSIEERLDRLHAAGMDSIDLDAADGGFYDLAIEGTFDDRVVFRLEGWNDPVGGGTFFECSIVAEGPDGVELGEPVEVAVEGVTRVKSARNRAELARGSALKSTLLRTLGIDGNQSGKLDGKAEDPSGGKAEDLKARTGSETGTTGEAARTLLELDDLELADT